MTPGIFAKTFPGEAPDTVMHAAKAAGFSIVQYNMACSGLAPMPDEIDDRIAGDISRAAVLAGVGIAAVSGTYNMIHPDMAVRQAGLRRLAVLAARCADMGTLLITLCTGTRDAEDQWRAHPDNASPEAWRDLCTAMAEALLIAEARGVMLGIEPELANVVDSAAKAKALIDQMQSKRLKVVLDPANLFEVATLAEQRDVVSEAIHLLGPHIVLTHAKDRMPDGRFAAAGQGCLDYGHYLRALNGIAYEGAIITHGLSAAEAPGVGRFLDAELAKLA